MRTFERTHPWISFKNDLRKAAPSLWMLLGEAASKCEHIAGVPLRPSVAQSLHQLYLAKGALATTAIEGNTLTEKEVLAHLEGKLKLPPSKEYLGQEVDNIVAACKSVGERLRRGDTTLTPKRVCEFDQQVLEKLTLEKGVVRGQVRTHSVVVGNVYRGAPAEDCQFLLERRASGLRAMTSPRAPRTYSCVSAMAADGNQSQGHSVCPQEESMSVFTLHSSVLADYRDFVRSFFSVADNRARAFILSNERAGQVLPARFFER